jgi:hypothetical protein
MLNIFAATLFQFQKIMFLDLQPILEDGLTGGQVGEEAARAAHLILDRTNNLLQFVGTSSSSACKAVLRIRDVYPELE